DLTCSTTPTCSTHWAHSTALALVVGISTRRLANLISWAVRSMIRSVVVLYSELMKPDLWLLTMPCMGHEWPIISRTTGRSRPLVESKETSLIIITHPSGVPLWKD